MNKNFFLTSAMVMGMFVPAGVALADIASDAQGAMCTSDIIGVSSGNTALEAIWYPKTNICAAGTYLNALTANCISCPENSYCAGGEYTYNGNDQGITSACPTDHYSDEGASAQTDCYRACTTDDVLHSTEVTGRYYYGDNNQCGATSCAAGYTPKSGFDLSTLKDAQPTNSGTSTWAYIPTDGNFTENTWMNGASKSQTYYGITEPNSWAASLDDFDLGIVSGLASCNSTTGNRYDTVNNPSFSTTSSGANCWCNINQYKYNNVSYDTGNTWILITTEDNYAPYISDKSANCASYCASNCANSIITNWLTSNIPHLFNLTPATQTGCTPNTLNIDWYDGDNVVEQNTCTYSETITLPATEPTRAGYNFGGWRLVQDND